MISVFGVGKMDVERFRMKMPIWLMTVLMRRRLRAEEAMQA